MQPALDFRLKAEATRACATREQKYTSQRSGLSTMIWSVADPTPL